MPEADHNCQGEQVPTSQRAPNGTSRRQLKVFHKLSTTRSNWTIVDIGWADLRNMVPDFKSKEGLVVIICKTSPRLSKIPLAKISIQNKEKPGLYHKRNLSLSSALVMLHRDTIGNKSPK